MGFLNVTSEIGRLRTVLLHRPGREIENLTPDLLGRLLFDDIPYLKTAKAEHDEFARTLRSCGVNVLYLENLIEESITDDFIREEFIDQFIYESSAYGDGIKAALKEYLMSLDNKKLIENMMSGIRQKDIGPYERRSLCELVGSKYPFICDPMPNLYFTRDPFATIGCGITLNHMRTNTRNRETIFAQYIFKYHPDFKNEDIPIWFNRDEKTALEGGDELVLSDELMAVGISQRTSCASVEKLCKTLLTNPKSTIKTVLCFDIPKSRAFMHLDTVFTQVDYDKFTIHAAIEEPLSVYAVSLKPGSKSSMRVNKEIDTLRNILTKYLGRDIKLIKCGGGDPVISAREQWNDGSNTLAIAPGEVIVYERNYITNEILENSGIKLHVIPSSELSRGRGGPRCMSMPLVRDDLR